MSHVVAYGLIFIKCIIYDEDRIIKKGCCFGCMGQSHHKASQKTQSAKLITAWEVAAAEVSRQSAFVSSAAIS